MSFPHTTIVGVLSQQYANPTLHTIRTQWFHEMQALFEFLNTVSKKILGQS